jgi:aryl-alcohol dehydrogenase-like predicted oxidoreductase
MQKRELGRSGIQISPFALGGNVFGWTIDKAKSFEVLDAFAAAGFQFIDTADVYSLWVPGNTGGESESILGEWMDSRKNRKQIIIATKLGKPMGTDKKGLSARYIREAVEASLTRLKTDYIDLYQSHDDDPDVPLEETMHAFNELIREGKVRAIGASNFTAERFRKANQTSQAHGYARYETLQPSYNLYDRSIEKDLQPLCVQEQVSLIPYYSLASGFLTGKYRSETDLKKSVRGGGVKKYMDTKGMHILSALDKISEKYKSTPATIAIAWLMAQPAVAAPIASATNAGQLRDLLRAVDLQLDAESLEILSGTAESVALS